jgi:Ala-tRNA(Pro) deacylase
MTIAPKIQHALDALHADYEIIEHSPSRSALENVEFARVPPERLAKAVLLDTAANGLLLAVLPSDRRLELPDLRDALGEKPKLADEVELANIFDDCAVGAVPPMGPGYGVATIVDDSLAEQPDIYFEGGDHISLVHLRQADFVRLAGERHGRFSEPWSWRD